MEEWLSDIAKINSDRRTDNHWMVLGMHHAQAAIARSFTGLPPGTRSLFLECLQSAAAHELSRVSEAELPYWRSYLTALVSMEVTSQPCFSKPTLVVNNGEKRQAA